MDPQSWNRYSYTRNNPVNRVDRLGLEDDEPIRIGVTACKGGGYAEDWGGTCPTGSMDGSRDVLGDGSHDGKPDVEEGDGTGGEPGGGGGSWVWGYIEYLHEIIKQATDDALEILKNNEKCRDLLTGKDGDPAKKLEELQTNKNIRPGPGYYIDDKGKRQYYEAIWYKDKGRILVGPSFFTKFGKQTYVTVTLNPAQRRTHTILHEIGHVTRAEAANHYKPNGDLDYEAIQKYNEKIAETCFSKKK